MTLKEKMNTDEMVSLLTVTALRCLVKIAKEKGFLQQDIAEFLQMDRTHFSKAVNGQNPFPFIKYVKFCFLLDVNPFGYLLPGDIIQANKWADNREAKREENEDLKPKNV